MRVRKTTLITAIFFVMVLAGVLVQSTPGAYASGNVSIIRTFNPPSDDSYVEQDTPAVNTGTENYLLLRSCNGENNERTFVNFDISSLPGGSTVYYATLWLYLLAAPDASRIYNAHRVLVPWSETTINWGNQPPLTVVTSSAATGTTNGVWLYWDVFLDLLDCVQYQKASNYGWAIKDSVENSDTSYQSLFYSREYTINNPTLSVQFTAPWDSYQDIDHTKIRDSFSIVYSYVYMKGTGFPNTTYLVAYYDASGVKRASEMVTVTNGTLYSQCVLNTDPTAAPGTWHALVQPASGYRGFGTNNYAFIRGEPDAYGLVANDSFTVDSSAIPEFPTAAAGIGIAVLCFGIYWYIRRRRLSYVK